MEGNIYIAQYLLSISHARHIVQQKSRKGRSTQRHCQKNEGQRSLLDIILPWLSSTENKKKQKAAEALSNLAGAQKKLRNKFCNSLQLQIFWNRQAQENLEQENKCLAGNLNEPRLTRLELGSFVVIDRVGTSCWFCVKTAAFMVVFGLFWELIWSYFAAVFGWDFGVFQIWFSARNALWENFVNFVIRD